MVALLPSIDGRGYQLVQSDASVTAFGDALPVPGLPFSNTRPPTVGAASVDAGLGILLTDHHGHVNALGTARNLGRLPVTSRAEIAGIVADPAGNGYSLISRLGNAYPFGTAPLDAPADKRVRPRSGAGLIVTAVAG